MTLGIALAGLAAAAALALIAWAASLVQRDASLVDRYWAWMIVVPGVVYALRAQAATPADWPPRANIVLALALLWAVRLSVYVTARNWGQGEDRRYQAIRARNQPGFGAKSLVYVFGLQAVLAWLVSAPLAVGVASGVVALGAFDIAGAALALFGIVFAAAADRQLAHFKADPAQRGQVMDRGLWRWSRHPNYFGEFCTWWGFWLLALGAGGFGAAWTVVSPVVMSVLLLRVSGVALLERDIGERRPAYRDYIARTSAFVPWPPGR